MSMRSAWSSLWSRKQATSSSLDLYRALIGGNESRSGITVNHKTALEASVAYACARVIAEGMSSIPFRLMRLEDSRRRLPAIDLPLYDLLNTSPNDHQTPVDFFDQIGLHLVFTGNAFVWLNRDLSGAPTELLPIDPGSVTVVRKGMSVAYQLTLEDGRRLDVPRADMWHIPGPSWNGWLGLDGVKLAREAIGLSLAGEQHGAATFSNGARLAGILTTDATLTREQREALRESWQATHGGAGNAGKIAVMSNGMKFIEVASSNSDAQWLEGRRNQVEEICRFFRVMPIMVGYTDKTATYASAEAMFDAHVRYTMLPWYRRIEKSADRWLLSRRDRAQGLYWKFFPAALLRSNPRDRGAFYSALYQVGAISPNEIREYEDLNPYPDGDQYRVPLNMIDPSMDAANQGNPADGTR